MASSYAVIRHSRILGSDNAKDLDRWDVFSEALRRLLSDLQQARSLDEQKQLVNPTTEQK